MISRFFIDRPIFASVLSIVIALAGALAIFRLPLAQYPAITPPTIQVSATYPGASAKVIAETIAAPIEQQVNGVEDMLYMASQSTNSGAYTLTVTFKIGVPLNIAQVRVQNRIQLALPNLPDVVKRIGLTLRKRSPDIMMAFAFYSPDGRFDQLYLSNYVTLHVRDPLSRLYGVGDTFIFGQRDYSMRAWLDPEKLAARNMTVNDVANALNDQNVQAAAGQTGQPPVKAGVDFQYPLAARGLLVDEGDFGDIVIKTGPSGEIVRLSDVSRLQLGAANEDVSLLIDGKPAAGIAVFQLPGTNVLDAADGIYAKMEELRKEFPEGIDFKVGLDTTPFIRESIIEVVKALRDSVLLVALVVLVFLQSWRTAIIPLVAVPVAVLGTLAVMLAVGMSLNNLSLFGLVLAIGIVVDDAIVVVENVERWLEHGLSPRDAARKAMDEVTGPVIAVALVLCAVFVPCAFVSGITGLFFRQFAITIAVSTVISAFNSLTLSPALAALLVKPKDAPRDLPTRILDGLLGWFFRIFNATFGVGIRGYGRVVGRLLRLSLLVLVVYAGLIYLTWWSLGKLPTGFIPQQDKGRLMANIRLPDAASTERTFEVVKEATDIALSTPGVSRVFAISGNSVLLQAPCSNFGTVFMVLEPFHERTKPGLTADGVIAELGKRFRERIKDAEISVFGMAPVDGLGFAGFKLQVEDRGDFGPEVLQEQVDNLARKGRGVPGITSMISLFTANTPQLVIDVDRTKCKTLGLPINDVFDCLQMYLGGYSVNQFVRFGRTWQVNIQADAKFRSKPEDVGGLRVRSKDGFMVPLASVVTVRDSSGPVYLLRYNMYPAASINGTAAQGVSSGDVIKLMGDLCNRELAGRVGYEWTDLSYLEITSTNTGLIVFALAVVFVFLTLAAQYESWSLPLSVVLVVPMCILSSVAGVALARQDVNIFTQIGFVVLIGLASKNAILIVEFARQLRMKGVDRREATLEACRLRLRPILMTSFAFVLGVVPLMLATGAGAEMRRALGTAVFWGMLGVTFFGILLTPVFFYVIDHFTRHEPAAAGAPPPH
jgi:multidrug efflux pump